MGTFKTRMHSSRMRTARFNGHLYRGGVCLEGCPEGCLPGCVSRGCLPGGCVQGVFVCRGVLRGLPRGCTPPAHCMLGYPHPPVDRQTPVKILPCPKLRLRALTSFIQRVIEIFTSLLTRKQAKLIIPCYF